MQAKTISRVAVLMTTIIRDYLQKDQAFMRQRRQALATPPGRTTAESRDGVQSQA